MKKALLLSLVIVCMASMAFAQGGTLGVYADPFGTNHYYEEIKSLIGSLLGSALKDNPYLYKGILTGILRIAQASIFSELNNLSVYSSPVSQNGKGG